MFAVLVELLSREGSRRIEVEVVVDTGATFTKIPGSIAERLGHVAEFRSRSRLGNGEIVERGIGPLLLRWGNITATVPVAVGGEGEIPVLGATALEILGLWVDPTGRTLVPRDSLDLLAVA